MAKCPICSTPISHHYWAGRAPKLEQAFQCPACEIPLVVTGLSRLGSLFRFAGFYAAIILLLTMLVGLNLFNWPEALTASLLVLLLVQTLIHRRCQTFQALAYPLSWGETVCNECKEPFHPKNAVQFGDITICPSCKPQYAQKIREGVA